VFPSPDLDEAALVARCLGRDEQALRQLDELYVERVKGTLTALGLQPADRDEVIQQLRERLLLDDPPRLSRYEGRGSLHGFIRAVAVRLALDHRRRRADDGDGALLGLADDGVSPELALEQRMSRGQFREAFHAALERLTPTQRTLLRQAYVDGLSNDAIGHLHGAHRATAFRWLVDARRDLSKLLRAELSARLAIPLEDIPPFAAFVRSQLSLSLSRVLR